MSRFSDVVNTEDAFECFRTYLALKLHFTTDSYDFHKYKGAVKTATEASFQKRRDKYFFFRLVKKYSKEQQIELFVANFLEDEKFWIGNAFSDSAKEVMLNWKGRLEALSYTFRGDIKKIKEISESKGSNFNGMFVCHNGQHPEILELLLHGEIAKETFIVLNAVFGFYKILDANIKEKIVWNDTKRLLQKYQPFMGTIDVQNFKTIMKEVLLSENN